MKPLTQQQFANCKDKQKLFAIIDGNLYRGVYDIDHNLFIRKNDSYVFRFQDCEKIFADGK